MRKYFIAAAIFAALVICFGCAKERSVATNADAKRYFDAWLSVYQKEHPEYLFTKAGVGSYILEDEKGKGVVFADSTFIFVTCTTRDLEGNIRSTTDSTLIDYDPSHYYGAVVWTNSDAARTVGVRDVLDGMRVGGKRKAIVPGWMQGTTRFATEDEFLANVTSGTNLIYEIEVHDATGSIIQWQIDSLERYSAKYLGDIDSTYYGFYYKSLYEGAATLADEEKDEEEEDDPTVFPDDTTLYINYTGRLLNGQVFDTTIADTAKVHNIYNASKTYEPATITYSSDSTAVKLGDNGVVTGFASLIKRLRNLEGGDKVMGVFYSSLGYGGSGSGDLIPGYAPLQFEVEVTPKEEK